MIVLDTLYILISAFYPSSIIILHPISIFLHDLRIAALLLRKGYEAHVARAVSLGNHRIEDANFELIALRGVNRSDLWEDAYRKALSSHLF